MTDTDTDLSTDKNNPPNSPNRQTTSTSTREPATLDGRRARRAPQLRADAGPIEIAPLPTIDGGWKTILADPPWRFTNRTGKVAPEHRRLDRYDTMTVKDICALPVADVAADQAHLYLWCPNALLPEGLQVMESWGFRYVTQLQWAKRRKDGGPDGRGVGFYFRNVTEPILFGVRGRMRTLAPARRQVNMIETRKREHSRKPDEQYPLIEACSPGPRLELFARYPQPDWTVWGNEAAPDVTPRGRRYAAYGGNGPLDGRNTTHKQPEGRHEPSEIGNAFGGYDCTCGQPWLTSLGGCQVARGKGGQSESSTPCDRVRAS